MAISKQKSFFIYIRKNTVMENKISCHLSLYYR